MSSCSRMSSERKMLAASVNARYDAEALQAWKDLRKPRNLVAKLNQKSLYGRARV